MPSKTRSSSEEAKRNRELPGEGPDVGARTPGGKVPEGLPVTGFREGFRKQDSGSHVSGSHKASDNSAPDKIWTTKRRALKVR